MINAISFNPAIQGKFLSYSDIKAELLLLGLTSTGSKEEDLSAIQKALGNSQNTEQTDKAASANMKPPKKGEHGEQPWFSLMKELGIQPTGSKEGDFAAIALKLSEMSSRATTEDEKAKVATLTSQFNQVMSQSTAPAPFEVAQNQTASLNKLFLLKSNG